MAKEIRIEVDDETYEQLQRLAADDHEDPDQYASRRLTADLARTRFLEGSARFLSAPGMREEFARRFGPEPGPSATAA
ncbi:hypothetical protein [Streptomyces mexicanus]|jgi:hypothetical protein|uniref:Ribbon-helix-helix protein CopG domain-containing protein n=1 Tax=Streptomyces mexicanus TaxID=178566 RepID=A0A7X1LSZ2_9ACTN|nr:hypothetical protein [Streptomyces mexicanus]MBC2868613.1 hypothetical protein [Streptomyces mexicanus]